MGFRKKEKVYVLKFDGELEGLEVRLRGASAGELIDLDGMKYSDAGALDELFLFFGSKLISWNFEEEDGTPITFEPQKIDEPRENAPALRRLETATEAKARVLRAQDLDFVFDILSAWKNAILGVSGPLERNSPDGEPFPEGSIPMETLSSNQLS